MNYWTFTKDRVTAFTKTALAFLILWAIFTWWGKMIYPHAHPKELLDTAAFMLAFILVFAFAALWYPYRCDFQGAVHYWWTNWKRSKTNRYEEESNNNEVLNHIQETQEILQDTKDLLTDLQDTIRDLKEIAQKLQPEENNSNQN